MVRDSFSISRPGFPHLRWLVPVLSSTGLALCVVGCEDGDGGDGVEVPPELEQVLDPETCRDCHVDHYNEWVGSMHAYAAEDPIFLAMNKRFQRENGGENKDFCVQCHAPLALHFGFTEDGLNLSDKEAVPQWAQGVTCYFCHNTASVDLTLPANNPLELAFDKTMRGAIKDPHPAIPIGGGEAVHSSAYSSLLDGRELASSDMCGPCHDVVTPHGVHLERTYDEWKNSIFAAPKTDQNIFGDTSCLNGCHMRTYVNAQPIAQNAQGRIPIRENARHDHKMVGVDLALVPFPDAATAPELQAAQRAALPELRNNAVCAGVCVNEVPEQGVVELTLWMHNEGAGHAWPSGAAQDRRAWLEVSALRQGAEVFGFGHVGPEEAAVDIIDANPNNWAFFDRIYNDAGEEVHMFWEARQVVSTILPVNNQAVANPESSSWKARTYILPVDTLDRVEMQLNLRAMGREVLESLVNSGDLDPAFLQSIETFQVAGADLIWPTEDGMSEIKKTLLYSDTGYGRCVSTSQSCRSPFICTSDGRLGCSTPAE